MKRCPRCNQEFPDKYNFCQYDKTTLYVIPGSETPPTEQTYQAGPTPFETQLKNLQTGAVKLGKQIRQQLVDKDVLGWIKGHVILLSSIAGGFVLLFILYYAFIKPDPSADGKKAALTYKECQSAYKSRVDATYQTFLKEFTGQNYRNRSDAEQKLQSLLTNERATYEQCSQRAMAEYNKLSRRYSDDYEDRGEFTSAFNSEGGLSMSAQELEEASPQYAVVMDKLGSIRAPYPDSQRIVSDLVGRSMDGWTFTYASEIKNLKVVKTELNGDVLNMRTNLDLEDYNSREPYFATLFLTYTLNYDGEWEFQNLNELVFTKPGTDYFIDGEIFLVGKWRWERNYAEYRPDGTWSGTWDNGTDIYGEWRIVNGNLVLTQSGNSWVNSKIVKFTKNELIVGENPSTRAERIE